MVAGRRFIVLVIALLACVLLPSSAGAQPGTTWHAMAMTGEAYTHLSFASDQVGWAAGDVGQVAVTTDGGASWTQVRESVSDTLTDVVALSASEAWVCGYSWVAASNEVRAFILHTTDGGASWSSHEFGQGQLYTQALAFPDSTHGWVIVGETLYATVDGGATWTPQAESTLMRDLFFLDADHGWVIASTGPAVGDTLLRTVDGGAHWTALDGDPAWDGYGDIVFADEEHGMLVHYYGAVATTDDGGLTWSKTGSPGWLNQPTLSAVDRDHVWMISPGAFIAATDDGGVSWVMQTTPQTGNYAGPADIVVRGDHGWAAGHFKMSTSRSGYGDLQPPVTTYSLPGFINHATTVELVATDLGSGVSETWYRVDGGAWQQGVAALLPASAALEGSEHVLEVSSIDLYGNAEAYNTARYQVDVTGPVVHFAPEQPSMMDYWTNKASRIGITADDAWNGSGLDRLQLLLNGTDWTDVPSAYQLTTTAPADHSNDGAHPVSARAADKVGNVGVTESHMVSIDTRRPTASAPYKGTAKTRGAGSIRFKIADKAPCANVCAVKVTVKSPAGRVLGVLQPKSWLKANRIVTLRFTCPLKAGKYVFWVQGGDGAGNTTAKPAHNYLIVTSGSRGVASQRSARLPVAGTSWDRSPGLSHLARRAPAAQ